MRLLRGFRVVVDMALGVVVAALATALDLVRGLGNGLSGLYGLYGVWPGGHTAIPDEPPPPRRDTRDAYQRLKRK